MEEAIFYYYIKTDREEIRERSYQHEQGNIRRIQVLNNEIHRGI